MSDPVTFGATGQFPLGKIDASDEGEIQIGVTVQRGTVILVFGTPVTWLGLPPAQARDVARTLLRRADEAEKAPARTREQEAAAMTAPDRARLAALVQAMETFAAAEWDPDDATARTIRGWATALAQVLTDAAPDPDVKELGQPEESDDVG